MAQIEIVIEIEIEIEIKIKVGSKIKMEMKITERDLEGECEPRARVRVKEKRKVSTTASAGPNADFGGQMDPCHPVTIVTLSPCRWESHLCAAVGAPLAMGFPALHWAAARVGVPRRAAVPAPTLPSTS